MTVTLYDLASEIVTQPGMNLAVQGASTGGSGTTLIDTTATAKGEFGVRPNDFWNGGICFHETDKEMREITDYVKSSQTITFIAMTNGFDAVGERYIVSRNRVPLEELIRSINNVVRRKRILKIDTTLSSARNQLDYTLPADVRDLREVWIYTDANDANAPRPKKLTNWRVVKAGSGGDTGDESADTLRFDDNPSAIYTIELHHVISHPQMDADTDELDNSIPKEHIVFEVARDYWHARMQTSRNANYQNNYNIFLQRLENAMVEQRVQPLPQVTPYSPMGVW